MNFGDKNNSSPRDWFKDSISFASLVIAILSLLAQDKLPQRITAIAIICLVVVAAVIIFPGVQTAFKRIRQKWKLFRLTNSHFGEFLHEVKEFRELTDHQNTNSLLQVCMMAAQWTNDAWLAPDWNHIEIIRGWLLSLEKRTDRCTAKTFQTLCDDFGQLVHHYNRLLLVRFEVLEKMVRTANISPERLLQLKRSWNVSRDSYVAFVRRWQSLAQTINREAGTQVCLEYYDSLATLE